MENLLFIDVETIRCTDDFIMEQLLDKKLNNIKPSANCKSDEAKAKSIQKQKDEFNPDSVIEKTVFDPSYGELITIGYAFDNEDVIALQRDSYVDEKAILQNFFDNIAAYADKVNIPVKLITIKWIAHNFNFDFGYIYKRSVINNINTHGLKIPFGCRHDSQYAYCTLQAWNGFGAKAGGSLDELCFLLGLKGKDGFDGSMVYGAWKAGEYDRISSYCRNDVDLLRQIYKRQQFIDD